MRKFQEVIDESGKFSTSRIAALSTEVSKLKMEGCEVVVNGSYARQEASIESDFDYFILHPDGACPNHLLSIEREVAELVTLKIGKLPGKKGAFGATLNASALSQNIGGNDDTNQNITRRVLFMTEGAVLGSGELFEAQRKILIERYISSSITDHQLGMFFLNDLIRYYRTICIDFEYKTYEDNKEWGTRNIKLIYSRKLLYFSGVLMTAELAQRSAMEKREIMARMVGMTPIERLKDVCRASSARAIETYATFLEAMQQPEVRVMLGKVTADRDTQHEEFRRLKNNGLHFGSHLLAALRATYADSHPIHRALIM